MSCPAKKQMNAQVDAAVMDDDVIVILRTVGIEEPGREWVGERGIGKQRDQVWHSQASCQIVCRLSITCQHAHTPDLHSSDTHANNGSLEITSATDVVGDF